MATVSPVMYSLLLHNERLFLRTISVIHFQQIDDALKVVG